MNILFVDQFSHLGGAQQCLLDLLPGVLNHGWTAHVALPSGGPLAARVSKIGAAVHQIRLAEYTNGRKTPADVLRFAAETPRLGRTIARLIDRHRIDLVYVNGPRVLPAAALASARIVFHSHSLLTTRYQRRLAGFSLWARGATVIASCRFVSRPLHFYVRPGKMHLVYNGIRDYGFNRSREKARPVRIGVIGRIAPEKGQADFIHAARILATTSPGCRFVVCGSPQHSGAAYRNQIRELAQGLPVEFTGWRDDIGPVLRELDIIVVPSTSIDGTTRIILEAFSAGIPVVAYPSGGIPEIVRNGATGRLTTESTPEALASSIRELMEHPDEMSRISECARAAYLRSFTVERFRRQVIEILERT